jgi:hypothetical protein
VVAFRAARRVTRGRRARMNKLSTFRREFQRVLLKEGFAGAIRHSLIGTTRYVIRYLSERFPSLDRTSAKARDRESDFDSKYSVDTSGIVPLSSLNIENENWVHGVRYQPVSLEFDFENELRGLDLQYDSFTFIDFGSGKGRALLLAAELPFKRIIGIEFARELHDIAERNIARYPQEAKKCKAIRSVMEDATQFVLPEEPLVLFFHNPFGPPVLTQVIANITDSYRKSPRRMIILVLRTTYNDLWANSPILRKVRDSSVLQIYETPA